MMFFHKILAPGEGWQPFALYFMMAALPLAARLSACAVWDVKRERAIRPGRSRKPG